MSNRFHEAAGNLEVLLDHYPNFLRQNEHLQSKARYLVELINKQLESVPTSCDPVAMPCTSQCGKTCAPLALDSSTTYGIAITKSEAWTFEGDDIKFNVTRVGSIMQISVVGKQVESVSIDLLVSGIFRDLHNAWKQTGHGT